MIRKLRKIYRILQRDAFQPFTPSPKELAESMRSKSDDELCAILTDSSKDYTSEAIEIAREELRGRGHAGPPAAYSGVVVGKSRPRSDQTAFGCGCLVLLYFAGAAIYGGYQWLDSIGWISHREETVISAKSDWLVGESKECLSAPASSDDAASLGERIGYVMAAVSCDDGPEHKMKVTFYGRKVQSEYKIVSWRCVRDETSFLNDNVFTCYQTGGQR